MSGWEEDDPLSLTYQFRHTIILLYWGMMAFDGALIGGFLGLFVSGRYP